MPSSTRKKEGKEEGRPACRARPRWRSREGKKKKGERGRFVVQRDGKGGRKGKKIDSSHEPQGYKKRKAWGSLYQERRKGPLSWRGLPHPHVDDGGKERVPALQKGKRGTPALQVALKKKRRKEKAKSSPTSFVEKKGGEKKRGEGRKPAFTL